LQTATLNVPRGEYVVKLSVKRVDSQPFTQVERGGSEPGDWTHNPPVTRLLVGGAVTDDLRVSQPSGQPTGLREYSAIGNTSPRYVRLRYVIVPDLALSAVPPLGVVIERRTGPLLAIARATGEEDPRTGSRAVAVTADPQRA
jgi:hypothetical protein